MIYSCLIHEAVLRILDNEQLQRQKEESLRPPLQGGDYNLPCIPSLVRRGPVA